MLRGFFWSFQASGRVTKAFFIIFVDSIGAPLFPFKRIIGALFCVFLEKNTKKSGSGPGFAQGTLPEAPKYPPEHPQRVPDRFGENRFFFDCLEKTIKNIIKINIFSKKNKKSSHQQRPAGLLPSFSCSFC